MEVGIYLPPPNEPPLRDEPKLVDLPNPPERGAGLLVAVLPGDVLDGGVANERWERVGLARVRARAATLSAFGEVAGWSMTGCDDRPMPEPALRELIVLPYCWSLWRFQPPPCEGG